MRNTRLDSRSARRAIGVIIRDAAADPGCFDTALMMDEDLAPVRIFRVRYLRETTFRNNGLVESDCADGISTSGNQGVNPRNGLATTGGSALENIRSQWSWLDFCWSFGAHVVHTWPP